MTCGRRAPRDWARRCSQPPHLLLPCLSQHGMRLRAHPARSQTRGAQPIAVSGGVDYVSGGSRKRAREARGQHARRGARPSTASTSTSAPSLRRAALETSEQKSTWPGESMRFTTNEAALPAAGVTSCSDARVGGAAPTEAAERGEYSSDMEAAFMVMPRSCRGGWWRRRYARSAEALGDGRLCHGERVAAQLPGGQRRAATSRRCQRCRSLRSRDQLRASRARAR